MPSVISAISTEFSGWMVPPPHNQRQTRCSRFEDASGAAIVCKSPGNEQVWEERYFVLPNGPNSLVAKLTAIAEGMVVAASGILSPKDQNISDPRRTLTKPKVIVFTACQNALSRINKLRKGVLTKQLRGDPIVLKLITRSQYLRNHEVGVAALGSRTLIRRK